METKRGIIFKCPNSYCNRTIKRKIWHDTGDYAFACCSCGAQLFISFKNSVMNITWLNKDCMPQTKICFICRKLVSPGTGKIYRGFNVHKNGCLEKLKEKNMKVLLLELRLKAK